MKSSTIQDKEFVKMMLEKAKSKAGEGLCWPPVTDKQRALCERQDAARKEKIEAKGRKEAERLGISLNSEEYLYWRETIELDDPKGIWTHRAHPVMTIQEAIEEANELEYIYQHGELPG